jgi:phosphatidylglycerophosphatase A
VNQFARLVATWFYCGYTPKGPGTAGSLAAVVIACLLHKYVGLPALGIGVLGLAMLGPAIWSADVVAKVDQKKDPQIVVVDEVVGQWITLAAATSLNWKSWLIGFAMFRLFDIWKPWPVRWFERLPGGTGIVMDDVMAGVYGALVLFAAGWFNLY